jgi:DNA invertase Pin-like site-specific DNA recombinase
MQTAYSYIRFSRGHQGRGDSLRRQLDTTRKYCKINKLALDESLSLKDLGVSGFKGRNVSGGALGRFIAAVEDGTIPPGVALVVESLDRLSRQSPRNTIALINRLLSLDVDVHLTAAGKVFRAKTDSTTEAMDLIVAVSFALRAHEESETKSSRLREAFDNKRKEIAQGKGRLVSQSVPWWLTIVKGTNRVTIGDNRAKEALLEIFDLTAAGWSSTRISREFNRRKIPTFREGTTWTSARIRATVWSDAPMGRLMPTPKTSDAGVEYQIEKYYPEIVPPALILSAREAMKRNRKGREGSGDEGRSINLLRGILRHQGRWCRFSNHKNGAVGPDGKRGFNAYYECFDEPAGKLLYTCPAKSLELTLLAGLLELSPEQLKSQPTGKTKSLIPELKWKLAELIRKRDNLLKVAEEGGSYVGVKIREMSTEIVATEDQLKEATQREIFAQSSVVIPHKELSASIGKLDDNETRVKVALALRRMIVRIDVSHEYESDDMDFVLGFAEAVEKDKETWLLDPIPFSKRRKPICLIITFTNGARRLIGRVSNNPTENRLVTHRLDPMSPAKLIAPRRSEA